MIAAASSVPSEKRRATTGRRPATNIQATKTAGHGERIVDVGHSGIRVSSAIGSDLELSHGASLRLQTHALCNRKTARTQSQSAESVTSQIRGEGAGGQEEGRTGQTKKIEGQETTKK